MKHKVFLFAVLVMTLGASAQQPYDFSAVAPSGQMLYYKIVNGDALVTRPTAYSTAFDDSQLAAMSGDVIIPTSVTHNGTTYTVTGFYNTHNVQNQSYGAFQNCMNITSVTIPNTITSLGDYTFAYCDNLKTVNIPNTVTTIGNNTFMYCDNLDSVIIPNSVTTIGNWAFSHCGKLKNIIIPNSITSIGNYAFNSCGLISLTLPNSVIYIGESAFGSMSGSISCGVSNGDLRMLYYDGPAIGSPWGARYVNGYEEDSLFYTSSNKRVLICAHPEIFIANIPNSVTNINNGAFGECTNLQTVHMGDSVTTIGNCAFSVPNTLDSISIPNTVTSIGSYAFSNVRMLFYNGSLSGSWGEWYRNGYCEDSIFYNSPQKNFVVGAHHMLTVANIPSTVTEISNNAFNKCRRLKTIVIPNTVSNIGSYAFSECINLTSIVIPVSVTNIGSYAFHNCSGLLSVSIPSSVSSIESGTFSECTHLASVTIPSTVTNIAWSAFYNCIRLESLDVPYSVGTIGNYAFENVNLVIYEGAATGSPWGAKSINGLYEDSLYYSTHSKRVLIGAHLDIVSANIPNSVISMQYDPFRDHSNLVSIVLSDSTTALYSNTFDGCINLKTVTIGRGLQTISINAFDRCNSIDTLYFNADSMVDFASTSRPLGLDSINVLIIGDSVQHIPAYLFSNHNNLTSLSISNSVNSIGNYAFCDCRGLTSVTIGNSVTDIGDFAFIGCDSIQTIQMLPSIPPNIGAYAFWGVNIPRNFYLPCKTRAAYQNAWQNAWNNSDFYYHEPDVDVNMTVASSDPMGGTVNIIQYFGNDVACDSTAIVCANPSYGYHLDHWSNGNTANPDTLHLTGDSAVTAFFAINQYTLTVAANDTSLGTVNGGGTFFYLDTTTITATCTAEHYHFERWSDGVTAATRVITVWKDSSITAIFALDKHLVYAMPTDGGYYYGDGEYEYGSTATVEAVPWEGFYFLNWQDGSTENPTYFTVTSDTIVSATFSFAGYVYKPSICMVSEKNNHNVVIWNKDEAVYQYNIYREGSVTNQYELVGTVTSGEPSEWMDHESHSMTRSYRYRMTTANIFGDESMPSTVHKTAHLTINRGVGDTWNLIWTEYEGTEFVTYIIYRGTSQYEMDEIDRLPVGGNTTYTDDNPPEGDVYYQVGIVPAEPCNPSKSANVIMTNIASNGSVGVVDVESTMTVNVYSTNGYIHVEGAENQDIEVYDMLGRQVVGMKRDGEGIISLSAPASGIYMVRVGNLPVRKVAVLR